MHVIHVVRQFYPAIGGLEDAVSNLAVALSRHCGIQSSIVTLDRCFSQMSEKLPAQAIYNGLSVHRIPFWGSTKYPLAPKIFRSLGEADIVHVHAVDSFFDALSLTRHWHKRPMVASTHGGFFHTTFASKLKVAYFNSITRASAQGYDRIIASSESDAAMFCRIAASKTVTIENGVNVGKWKDASSSVPTRTMIYIGRFSSNKNIEGLVKLVAALHRLHEGWRLIVAGGPADITPSQIEAYTHDTSTEGVVSIVSAPSDDHIKTLIGQASYIASASAYEGFGLSIVEGLSAGLTPIVNDIPPFRRLVKSSGTGTLINIADVEAAAVQVEAAHQENIGTYASQRVENVEASTIYDWSAVSRKFANVYTDVLETYV
jgi:alpha-1,3-mannosyltransferase